MSDLPSDPTADPEGVDLDGPVDADGPDGPDGVIDRLRGTGAGVEDPTIVGDAGPVDRSAVGPDAAADDLPVTTAEDGDPGQV